MGTYDSMCAEVRGQLSSFLELVTGLPESKLRPSSSCKKCLDLPGCLTALKSENPILTASLNHTYFCDMKSCDRVRSAVTCSRQTLKAGHGSLIPTSTQIPSLSWELPMLSFLYLVIRRAYNGNRTLVGTVVSFNTLFLKRLVLYQF